MTSSDGQARLRIFKDGAFVEERSGPTPLLPEGFPAATVLGYGCLVVMLVPLTLVTL